MSRLLVITTHLPPAICGVGTYAWQMMRHWPAPDIEVIFLVRDGAAASREQLPGVDVRDMPTDQASILACLEAHPDQNILLHYTTRAYHRYAAPLVLLFAMRAWRRRHPKRRLVIIFHELWDEKVSWFSRQKMIQSLARYCVHGFARLADEVFTHTGHHARQLERLNVRAPIRFHPVAANILPSQERTEGKRNMRAAVLFGLSLTRVFSLRSLGASLRQLHQENHLEMLHVIGPSGGPWGMEEKKLLEKSLPAEAICFHGEISERDISRLLGHSGFFLFGLPWSNHSKSTTFMAAAVHGCAIVTPDAGADAPVPLRFCIHPQEWLQLSPENIGERVGSKVQQLRDWYRTEADWPTGAARVAAAFSNS